VSSRATIEGMSRPAFIGITMLGALALAGGCKDDDSVSAEAAPEALAADACALYFECACDAFVEDAFTSREHCESAVEADVQRSIDEGEAAGLTYDGRCVDDYLDTLDDMGCATFVDLLSDPGLIARFEQTAQCKMFYGTRTAGQPCEVLVDSDGDDCVRGLVCENEVCTQPPVRKAAGEPCDVFAEECDIGLVCLDVDGGTATVCHDLPEGGETCLGAADLCDVDFYCDQGSKTCGALPSVGETCNPTPNVVGRRCGENAVCSDATDSCVEAPGGGQACFITCQTGFVCEGMVCVEQPPLVCTVAVTG
jgi:hypothetical protein